MSHPSALPATTPSDDRLRNALCVLLDHLEMGQADVLAADVAWVSELVASFAVSPSEGSAPDTPAPEDDDDLADQVALQVLCRVFDDGVDVAMDEWRAFNAEGGFFWWARALGAFIRGRLDDQRVPPSAPDTKPDERIAEIAALRAEREAMRHVIAWLLGEEGDFPSAPDDVHTLLADGRQYRRDRGISCRRPRFYWWRGELRDRWAAAISVGPDNPANLRASSPPEGEDTQRIDFLCGVDAIVIEMRYKGDCVHTICSEHPETLREAIDSARAAIPTQEKGHE